MAAAVADFRPKKRAKDKIKKQAGLSALELEKTTDILLSVAGMGADRPHIVVGFAAESRDLIINATQKLESKHLDLIAANDISSPDSGFEVGTNRLTLIYADGRQEPLPLMTKDEAAEVLLERITSMLEPS
jgi:phosphopantothenoylcysteine decarboxylase/phosphopantothenate--cysteine ligase